MSPGFDALRLIAQLTSLVTEWAEQTDADVALAHANYQNDILRAQLASAAETRVKCSEQTLKVMRDVLGLAAPPLPPPPICLHDFNVYDVRENVHVCRCGATQPERGPAVSPRAPKLH